MAGSYSSEGGYDYEFFDTITDNLICKICHFPSREPHLSVCCGHTFCDSCLKKAKKSTFLSEVCPMCRTEKFTSFPNKQNERAVLSLLVRCTNAKGGCDWTGEVGNITKHLSNSDGCKFEVIHCPNNCGKVFERQCLADHVVECPCRTTKCQYCHTEGEYQFIEGSHKQQCYKFPVPRPNNCEIRNVPSEHLQEHVKVCPLQVVHCQYHDVGCKAEMARKDLVKHDEEKANDHLMLMKSALFDTKNKLADTENRLGTTEKRLACLIKVVKANHAEVLAKVDEAKFECKTEFLAEINELESTLKEKTKLCDMLVGEWAIEIHTEAAKLSSCNQLLPVTIKMPDVTKNTKNRVDWYSDPFYTHHQGYKMQLNVIPAGYGFGEDRYMSVYLCIMDGPFDNELRWELRGRFEVTLLNQICDSRHHSFAYRVHANRGQPRPFWYCDEFISFEDLRKMSASRQYMKDDCIFFEVCEL